MQLVRRLAEAMLLKHMSCRMRVKPAPLKRPGPTYAHGRTFEEGCDEAGTYRRYSTVPKLTAVRRSNVQIAIYIYIYIYTYILIQHVLYVAR